jgi:hypothetical protein
LVFLVIFVACIVRYSLSSRSSRSSARA